MAALSENSDSHLFGLLCEDNTEAFSEIYNRYKGVLFVHSFKMLRDKDEAKDVVQELFTHLWAKRHELRLNHSLSSYLYSSVRNRVLDIIAHKKVKDRYINSLEPFFKSGVFTTDEYVRSKELQSTIEKEISFLPPKMREVFELSRDAELSHKEIASKLNISDKTVKKQISKSLNLLRQKLDLTSLLIILADRFLS